jgi:hypothetical protein
MAAHENQTAVPDWNECWLKNNAGKDMAALEKFVLDNEPQGEVHAEQFREGLQAVLDEVRDGR